MSGLWVKISIEVLTDPKLVARQPWERWLWVGVLCLAKQHAPDDGILLGYDARALASVLALGVPWGRVETAIDHFASVGMVERVAAGLKILNWRKRQVDPGNADRQRKHYWKHREPNAEPNGQPNEPNCLKPNAPNAVEKEKEGEKEEEKNNGAATADAGPLLAEVQKLEADWPTDMLGRVRSAFQSARKSGVMADSVWLGFLRKAAQYAKPRRLAAATVYLDRGHGSDKKVEQYLIGMMEGGAGLEQPRQMGLGAQRPRSFTPPDARAATPGVVETNAREDARLERSKTGKKLSPEEIRALFAKEGVRV